MSEVVDRRQQRRLATLEALKSAALELALEFGPENVTVDDIVERADVSRRTFFNYFASKHDAILGISHLAIAAAAQSLRERPADEAPLAALGWVLSTRGEDADVIKRWWADRNELIHRYPNLLERHLTAFFQLEDDIVDGITPAETGGNFSTVDLSRIAVSRQTHRATGFNVGFDMSYMFARHVGAGTVIRYSTASADLVLPDGSVGPAVEIGGGGFELAAGLRFRF